jgi:uncharacterized protein with beta-barrel porin domain
MVEHVRKNRWSLDTCVGHARLQNLFQPEQIPCTKTLYNMLWTNGHGFATSFGFDHSVGNSWRLGEFFSYGDNSFAGTNSSLKNKDYRLGIYGIREKGPSQIFLYLDAGRQNNDSKRYISAGANYMAESSYKSNTIELGGRYTYDTDYGKAQSWHRKPYGEVQVVRYSQDGYNETGAGVWNQSVGSGSSTYSAATVGLVSRSG